MNTEDWGGGGNLSSKHLINSFKKTGGGGRKPHQNLKSKYCICIAPPRILKICQHCPENEWIVIAYIYSTPTRYLLCAQHCAQVRRGDVFYWHILAVFNTIQQATQNTFASQPCWAALPCLTERRVGCKVLGLRRCSITCGAGLRKWQYSLKVLSPSAHEVESAAG